MKKLSKDTKLSLLIALWLLDKLIMALMLFFIR